MHRLECEKTLLNKFSLIAGLDEAGRGPLAGPLVAASVAIGRDTIINTGNLAEVNDSKKLSPRRREGLFELLTTEIAEIGIGICDHITVDRINVLQATFLAMSKAVSAHRARPQFLLVDGNKTIPNFDIQQRAEIGGDARVFLIAAASIIAKVTRDRLMMEYHELYPEYGFDQHKGYGTKLHMENLDKYGPCPIHRVSFAPVKKKPAKKGCLLGRIK